MQVRATHGLHRVTVARFKRSLKRYQQADCGPAVCYWRVDT